MPPPSICFFARVANRAILERVEFYAQDLRILRALGYHVTVATRMHELRRADLYFVWWWTWAFIPIAVARLLGRPVVITGVFNTWSFGKRPWAHRVLLRWCLKAANANIFVSELEYHQVCDRFPVANPQYVPLGVDTDVYRPNGDRAETVLLSIGWLAKGNAERKGFPMLLRAVPKIRETAPEVRVLIAGEQGSAYGSLLETVRDLGIGDCVTFLGVVTPEDKVRLLQTCQAYVQPSVFEGFGLAILEALSCGAPVVCSNRGALPEVVGEAAVLVDPDDVESVARGVTRVLSSPELRRRLSNAGRKRALSFTFDRRSRELRTILAAVSASYTSASAAS